MPDEPTNGRRARRIERLLGALGEQASALLAELDEVEAALADALRKLGDRDRLLDDRNRQIVRLAVENDGLKADNAQKQEKIDHLWEGYWDHG
jgi:chromosome segregation ATPase